MLCTGPHGLLHLHISNARRGLPRHGIWRLHTVQTESADLFNVAHFRAKTKSTDDSALVAHSAEEMPNRVDAFSNASKKFGLKMNTKKTEVL